MVLLQLQLKEPMKISRNIFVLLILMISVLKAIIHLLPPTIMLKSTFSKKAISFLHEQVRPLVNRIIMTEVLGKLFSPGIVFVSDLIKIKFFPNLHIGAQKRQRSQIG